VFAQVAEHHAKRILNEKEKYARFPFNASLQELRLRKMRNRLIQLRPAVTSRPVREIKTFWTKRTVVHALSPVRHFASVGGDSQVQAGPGSCVASGAPLGCVRVVP
jgi:hypothetical protein